MRWCELGWEKRKGKEKKVWKGKEIRWEERRGNERKGCAGKDVHPVDHSTCLHLPLSPEWLRSAVKWLISLHHHRGPAAASQHCAHDVSHMETLLRTHWCSCSPLQDKIQRGWSFTSYRFPTSLSPSLHLTPNPTPVLLPLFLQSVGSEGAQVFLWHCVRLSAARRAEDCSPYWRTDETQGSELPNHLFAPPGHVRCKLLFKVMRSVLFL